MPPARAHTVVALLFEGLSPFEFAVGCEVFGIDRRDLADPWYRFLVAAVTPPPVPTATGFTIDTPHGLEALAEADTVYVSAGTPRRSLPEEAYEAMRAAHRRGARMISVCTGAFVLAEAGLLDGRRVATHWMNAAELERAYPEVEVDSGVLYVDDGDILTSAGTAAGIDLCLHVVRRDHGAQVANALARRMVVPPHRQGDQAQYVEAPIALPGTDDLLGRALAWAVEHLDEPIGVETLARRAGLSPRHFARRFRAREGTTPLQWLLHQRILLARRLLETTDEPVEQVARSSGFQTATSLRPHFQRLVHTTPLAYRHTFRVERAG
ncbi:MAG: GlxA family transcriptional regulator [Acidimicrobiales bacterium]